MHDLRPNAIISAPEIRDQGESINAISHHSDAPLRHCYIHVPFCTGRCAYCAFHSGPPPNDIYAYIQALVDEKKARQIRLAPLSTLYCGGGTPGLLGEKGFRALVESGLFTFEQNYEWSVELHPTTVTKHLIKALADLGVNRISIGVQAFDDTTLLRCNRRHTIQQALDAIDIARAHIPDTGIDLIAALPGVAPQQWEQTLDSALALDLPHLSIYTLSIDEGSRWHAEGLPPPDEDLACDAILTAQVRLEAAGYIRYETSNYAKPGFQCRHNLNTWLGGDYVGLGSGAHSRLGTLRRDGTGHEEFLSLEEDALERALTTLRLSTGFNIDNILQRFPNLAHYHSHWEDKLTYFRAIGLLNEINAPTPRGYEVLDAIERALL